MAPRFSRAAACALITLLGCSHAPAPQPAPTPAAPQANAPAPAPAPAPQAEAPAPAPRLEASEVITTDELASIPDPVPGAGAVPIEEGPLNPDAKPLPVAPAPTSAAPPPSTPPAPPPTSTAPQTTPPESKSPAVWRVQVFASPDRAQAERVAREAAQALGAPYVLTKDGDLVKVRLGSFVREEDAQALKERAVKSGYAGAFRVLDKGGS
jgi:sporulation related protein